ncbi:hypothetical protein EWB00_000202 [Schistosoma japonicum]|uniref:Uncharacterized protein n=1 Tax=Schistosoma japonicum TaxID=6182 RepID=A0A4Z2CL32_SCHJA|nr:hypothetical protein EWB00_000202 [Schistosoma japonicum]
MWDFGFGFGKHGDPLSRVNGAHLSWDQAPTWPHGDAENPTTILSSEHMSQDMWLQVINENDSNVPYMF